MSNKAIIYAALLEEHRRRSEEGVVASPEEHCSAMAEKVVAALTPVSGRYVMVGFGSTLDALKFLGHLHELDEDTRELLTATRTAIGVSLKKYKVQTAYLKDV